MFSVLMKLEIYVFMAFKQYKIKKILDMLQENKDFFAEMN